MYKVGSKVQPLVYLIEDSEPETLWHCKFLNPYKIWLINKLHEWVAF